MGNPIGTFLGTAVGLDATPGAPAGGGDEAAQFEEALINGAVSVAGNIALGGIMEAGQDDAEYLQSEY